ncbi:hypothetical protein [Propionivibrio soli]|uniref:hypothetical protein n=1 Tax=Propionivibrio soli TaxID=2976531 RepID=UPI0021E9AB79|nr:hypothetical protein [Propionivibrio soli]
MPNFPMKHLSFVTIGTAVFALVTFLVGSLLTHLYCLCFAQNDADINFSMMVFLAVWPFVAILGGYVGHHIYKIKSAGKHSDENRCQPQ